MTARIDEYIEKCAKRIEEGQNALNRIALKNQERVLEAFWRNRVSQIDLSGTTGYGLSDGGREKFETIFAEVFGTERALVRPQIVSGTHAITLGLFGVLRPGDEVLFATGTPYDTLHGVIGLREAPGNLLEWGITTRFVDLDEHGHLDMNAVCAAVSPRTKLVWFQRSRGYSARPSLDIAQLEAAFSRLKHTCPHVLIAVDNCYGEFVEEREPTHVGADIAMGSLIKNPGAGIAPTGGYIVGRADLLEGVASRLVAPGTAAEYGPTGPYLLPFYQALFLAPHTVVQAVKGSRLFAAALEGLSYTVSPSVDERRTDLILSVDLEHENKLLQFCEAIQSVSPVDAHARPEAGEMAGYGDTVVMAAGTFIQGASLELSADAPVRPPYRVFVQGGLTYEHVVIALKRVLEKIAPQLC